MRWQLVHYNTNRPAFLNCTPPGEMQEIGKQAECTTNQQRSSDDVGVFVQEYQIYEEDVPDNLHNMKLLKGNPNLKLELICDTKSRPVSFQLIDCTAMGDEVFYRLSEDKLLNWLRHKIDAISLLLPSSTIDLMSLVRAQATGYRSTKDEKLSNSRP